MPSPAPSTPDTRIRYLELLARAVAHVQEHLAEPLDTEALARQAAMSPFHFHRMFRAYFGTTVGGYVTWRRLVGSSRVDLQACKLEYSIVSPK